MGFGSGVNHKGPQPLDGPAPTDYDVPAPPRNSSWRSGFGLGHSQPDIIDNPGPGAYDAKEVWRGARAATCGSPHEPVLLDGGCPIGVAPGTYDVMPPRGHIGNIGFGAGAAHKGPNICGADPAPTDYDPSLPSTPKSLCVGFGLGHEGAELVDTPGPGGYDTESLPKGHSRSTGIGLGKRNDPAYRGAEVPGPGAYNSPTRWLQSRYVHFGSGMAHLGPPAVKGPGPGTYNPVMDDRTGDVAVGVERPGSL